MKDNQKKIVKLIAGIGIIAILLSILFITFRKNVILPMEVVDHSVDIISDNGNYIELLHEGDEIEQNIKLDNVDEIYGFALRFGTFQEDLKGNVVITIKEEEKRISEQSIDLNQLEDNAEYIIPFESGVKADRLKISIKVKEIKENTKVAIYTNTKSNTGFERLLYNGEQEESSLGCKIITKGNLGIQWMALIVFIILFLMLAFVWCWLLVFNKNWQSIVFPVVLGLGLIYILILTPGSVPDETSHFITAYSHANDLLGEKNKIENFIAMREEDNLLPISISINQEGYKNLLKNFGGKVIKGEMKASQYEGILDTPRFEHLPGTIGISLARLLGLNSVSMFYLGRFFNLLFYAVGIFLAVKMIPVGKMAIFIIAVFPISLQEAASYSYDAVVIAIGLMFCSYCLKLIQTTNSEIKIQDIIIIAILGTFFAGCKSGAYLPICFMVVLIGYDKSVSKKQYWTFLVGVIVIMLIGYGALGLGGALENVGGTASDGFSVQWLLLHPKYLLYMIVNTILGKADFYYESLIGYNLGHFNAPTFMVVTVVFTILLLITFIDKENDTWKLATTRRWILGALIICSIGLIEASMLLGWTKKDSIYIEGVQGRYFLPLLIPCFILFKNHAVVLKKNIDRQIMMIAGSMHVLIAIALLEVSCK